jgi:hypothetical protein
MAKNSTFLTSSPEESAALSNCIIIPKKIGINIGCGRTISPGICYYIINILKKIF